MGDGAQAALHNAAVVDTHNVRRCGTFKVDVESLDVNEERSSVIITDDEGRELWLKGINDNTVCVTCSDTDYLAHSASILGVETLAETSAERLETISAQLRPGSVVAMVFGLDAIRISNVFVTSMEKCGPYDIRAVDLAQPLRPEYTFVKMDIEGSEMPILAQIPVRQGKHQLPHETGEQECGRRCHLWRQGTATNVKIVSHQ